MSKSSKVSSHSPIARLEIVCLDRRRYRVVNLSRQEPLKSWSSVLLVLSFFFSFFIRWGFRNYWPLQAVEFIPKSIAYEYFSSCHCWKVKLLHKTTITKNLLERYNELYNGRLDGEEIHPSLGFRRNLKKLLSQKLSKWVQQDSGNINTETKGACIPMVSNALRKQYVGAWTCHLLHLKRKHI